MSLCRSILYNIKTLQSVSLLTESGAGIYSKRESSCRVMFPKLIRRQNDLCSFGLFWTRSVVGALLIDDNCR